MSCIWNALHETVGWHARDEFSPFSCASSIAQLFLTCSEFSYSCQQLPDLDFTLT